ncbi:hypothetical protein AVEN_108346-1 [Araneus ventricosus]|uniref:Uncharacterized protein n=1 Tax=Araneus ventricosus TaxID=182803 RepID=A0A4Y2CW71_ARAVE|nr:hypothetical protein AVEN_108346-1 [Araneus ventricosus]
MEMISEEEVQVRVDVYNSAHVIVSSNEGEISSDSMCSGATKRTLTSAWKKLWPKSVVECDFEGFEPVPVKPVVNEVVSLAKILGLEVEDNIDELEEDHSQELTTEELMELHSVSQQEIVEESLSEKEEVTAKQLSSGAIKRNAESMGNCSIAHRETSP